MEERIIDDEFGRGIRLKKTKDGYVDATDELAPETEEERAEDEVEFSFPVFDELTVRLKFYHADEDFPASLVLLWEENTLQYIYYETVFYIAGFLLRSILDQMSTGRTTKEETT
jgi:hypothetical protein